MEVANQPQACSIATQTEPPDAANVPLKVSPHMGMVSPQMISVESQCLTWDELNTQIISDTLTNLTIRVNKEMLPAAIEGDGCEHVIGLQWKDIVNTIVDVHNNACGHTALKLVPEMLCVAVNVSQVSHKERDDMEEESDEGEDFDKLMDDSGPQSDSSDRSDDDLDDEGLMTNENFQSGQHSDYSSEMQDPSVDCGEVQNEPQNASDMQIVVGSSAELEKKHNNPNLGQNIETDVAGEVDEAPDNISQNGTPPRSNNNPNPPQRGQLTDSIPEDNLVQNTPSPVYKNSRHKPAQCMVCLKWFKSEWLLANHSAMHFKDGIQHQCEVCEKIFKTKSHLKQHGMVHNTENKLQMASTPEKSDKAKTVSLAGFNCSICQLKFKSHYKLVKHEKTHQLLFPCQGCTVRCKSQTELKEHQSTHAYKCDRCDASYSRKVDFLKHQNKAHDIEISEKHVCNVCNAVYRSKYKLQDHKMKHSDNVLFTCDVCQKKFRRPSQYQRHIKKEHKEVKIRPNSYRCGECSKEFCSQGGLNSHVRRAHLLERPYTCSFCTKTFFSITEKGLHEMTHSGVMPFVCSFCNKGYRSMSALTAHIKTHQKASTDDTPCHKCQCCGREFNKKADVERHLAMYHYSPFDERARPFKCSICGRCFIKKSLLTHHEMRHTGERNYKCPHCSLAFVYNTERSKHIRTKHKLKPHGCQQCDLKFDMKSELLKHQIIHGKLQGSI